MKPFDLYNMVLENICTSKALLEIEGTVISTPMFLTFVGRYIMLVLINILTTDVWRLLARVSCHIYNITLFHQHSVCVFY